MRKGDVMMCVNYRPVSLLCATYKIVANILFVKLVPFAEEVTGEYQGGYQRGRSTFDQTFTMRKILEKCQEQNIDVHHMFIYFQVAYDTVCRKKILSEMHKIGFPQKKLIYAEF